MAVAQDLRFSEHIDCFVDMQTQSRVVLTSLYTFLYSLSLLLLHFGSMEAKCGMNAANSADFSVFAC